MSFVPHRFEITNIDTIKALFEVIHTQLAQFQQTEPKVTVQSAEQLTRKLKELALTVCSLSQIVQAIDSLYELGMRHLSRTLFVNNINHMYLVPEFKGQEFDELRSTFQIRDEVKNINAPTHAKHTDVRHSRTYQCY